MRAAVRKPMTKTPTPKSVNASVVKEFAILMRQLVDILRLIIASYQEVVHIDEVC